MIIYEWRQYSRITSIYEVAVTELKQLATDWEDGKDTAIGLLAFREGSFAALEDGYAYYQRLVAASVGYLAGISGFVFLVRPFRLSVPSRG